MKARSWWNQWAWYAEETDDNEIILNWWCHIKMTDFKTWINDHELDDFASWCYQIIRTWYV